jgi:hypothetical protein
MTFQDFKRHLISLGITFVATFLLVTGLAMSQDNFVFSKDAVIITVLSAASAGARAVAKIVYELCYSFLSTKK